MTADKIVQSPSRAVDTGDTVAFRTDAAQYHDPALALGRPTFPLKGVGEAMTHLGDGWGEIGVRMAGDTIYLVPRYHCIALTIVPDRGGS